MKKIATILVCSCILQSACGQTDADIKKNFERFNINGDSWLDGIEVDNCRCKQYDTNGDNEVSFAEFKAGFAKNKPANTGNTQPRANQAFTAGSKVEIDYNGRWYPGSVLEVNGDQYKIHYDNYGANWDTWVSKEKLRAVGAGETATVQQKESVPNNNIQTGNIGSNNAAGKKRVEVRINGYWYKATVLAQKGDSYLVHYDGYDSKDDTWILKSYIRDLTEDEQPVTVACSFAAPAGNFNDGSPASAALFKKEVYDWYKRRATGGVESPQEIGVVFTSFEIGSAYKNTVTNVPGQGATRRHEGAPANTTIHTAKVTLFVCERYATGTDQKQVNANFSLFKSKDGEWTCSKDN